MPAIFTIGHSTRSFDELLELLQENGVTRLADIRRYPGSRRFPHFSGESLRVTLPRAGIAYVHLEALGGRRQPLPDTPNTFWENDQFRGYADHMGTEAFRRAVDALVAATAATAVMCAEAVPWRCHRNLLADDLVRRGVEVLHITAPATLKPHVLHAQAKLLSDRVIYPADTQKPLGFGKL